VKGLVLSEAEKRIQRSDRMEGITGTRMSSKPTSVLKLHQRHDWRGGDKTTFQPRLGSPWSGGTSYWTTDGKQRFEQVVNPYFEVGFEVGTGRPTEGEATSWGRTA
jgi:hypothetical protein